MPVDPVVSGFEEFADSQLLSQKRVVDDHRYESMETEYAYRAWHARDAQVAQLEQQGQFWCAQNDASQAQVAKLNGELRDRDEHIKYSYAALGPGSEGVYLFDHIAKLKSQIAALTEENRNLADAVASSANQLDALAEENQRLREQLAKDDDSMFLNTQKAVENG